MQNHRVAQSIRVLAGAIMAVAEKANKSHPLEIQLQIRQLKALESSIGFFDTPANASRYVVDYSVTSVKIKETARALEQLFLSEKFFDSHVRKLSLAQLREFNDKLVAFRSRKESFEDRSSENIRFQLSMAA